MISPQKLKAMKIIREEYKNLVRTPLASFGIIVELYDDNNIFDWKCSMVGPQDSCYKGGLFNLRIQFPDNYPEGKPVITFVVPIYHLNVKYWAGGAQPLGYFSFSSINEWNSEYRMNKLLPEIFYLLKHNEPETAFDDQQYSRRNEFLNNRALFEEKAKYFTKKYANPLNVRKVPQNTWDFTYPE